MHLTLIALVAILAFLPSCSCAIYRRELTPSGGSDRLTDTTTASVAHRSGFTSRTPEKRLIRYARGDVELLLDEERQIVIIRSSLCPPFVSGDKVDRWQQRCEECSSHLEAEFRSAGTRLRELSEEELLAPTKPNKSE